MRRTSKLVAACLSIPMVLAACGGSSAKDAKIVEVANATHLIHAEFHTSDAYLTRLRAAIDTASTTSP